jgi:hypothetical protein
MESFKNILTTNETPETLTDLHLYARKQNNNTEKTRIPAVSRVPLNKTANGYQREDEFAAAPANNKMMRKESL